MIHQECKVKSADVKLVNQLHADLREAEAEQPDLIRSDVSGTYKKNYWRAAFTPDGKAVMRKTEALVTDNRARWKALNDMYWFHNVVIPLMTGRKTA